MSLDFLDYFITGILLFIIIGILIGKGDAVMKLLNGKQYNNDPNRPRYDKKKEQRAILAYCLLLLADQILIKIGSRYSSYLILVGIGIAIVGFIGVTYYLKHYAQIK